MKTMKLCPECGQVLAPDALLGLCPECMMKAGLGTVAPPPSPNDQPASGARVPYFGDYELVEEIARGGMGVVWKARQASLNRIVAVKMILSGRLAGEAEVKRFRTEAEAAAKLQHPNIVAIHEVDEHEGQHYFSMDFVEGQSLAEMVFHRPLLPEQAAKYLLAIAEAIHYAHEKGVLHRDLKPSNVLVDHADQPRVTDFGLAKLVQSDSGVTHSGAVMGSPSYMSPEQASGKTREIGPATDIYSLGAILYELITGRPPFRAATPLDTMKMVVESETAAPKWVNPAVPADLETICLKCLEKDPRRRYESAKALADDLDRFLKHEPIQARPATRLYRVEKWIKRKPAQAALVGVIALALLALAFGGWRYAVSLRKSGIEINERLRQTLIEQSRAERLLGHREAALQRITEAAKIRRTEELRTEAIQAIAQPGVRRVFDAPMGAVAISRFSADGKLLAVGGEGYVTPDWPGYASNAWQAFVRIWQVPSGKLVGAWPWHLEAGPFALSPDARLLAVPQTNENVGLELAVLDLRTSNVTARLPVFGPSHFSPDGKFLAVQETNRVSLFVRDGERWKPGPRYDLPAVVLTWTASDKLLMQRLAWPGPEDMIAKRTSTNDSMRLIRWNVATGQQTFPLNDGGVIRVRSQGVYPTREGYGPDTEEVLAVSADGRAAATHRVKARSTPEEMFIRDLDTGKKLGTLLPLPFPNVATERPETILLSAHGRRLVFPDVVEPGRVRVYDVNSGRYLSGVGEPGASIEAAFDQIRHGTGGMEGTSGSGTNFMRYKSRSLQHWSVNRPSPDYSWVCGVRNFSPDGTLFAIPVGGGEQSIALWELDSGRRFASIGNAWNPVWAVDDPVWSADGRWLAVTVYGWIPYGNGGSMGGGIAQVWEVLHGVPTHRLAHVPARLAFNPDGRQLAAHTPYYGTVLWEVERSGDSMTLHGARETLSEYKQQLGETEILFATNVTWVLNDTRHSLVGALSQAVRLGSKEEPFPLAGQGRVQARTLSPEGQRLLIACDASRWDTNAPIQGPHLQLWDLVERKRVAVWPYPGGKLAGGWSGYGPLVFSPDGRRIASACFTNSGIEIWDAVTGQRLHQLHPPPWSYQANPRRPFAQLGQMLFHKRGAPPTPERYFYENSVAAIAITPDSRLVVSCAEDRAVIRELETGHELAQCRTTTNMLCLAISPDGHTLATGDEDRQIRLWDIPSGRELTHWPAHDAAVVALAFSPDGATLASGARDATMKLWNLPFIRRELKKLGLDW